MNTMCYNTLEIEFANEQAKEEFKRITNTSVGGNELLELQNVMPLPPPNFDNESRETWVTDLWGAEQCIEPGLTSMKEDGLTLTYSFQTLDNPPLIFMRYLYFYFQAKRVRLQFNFDGDLEQLSDSAGNKYLVVQELTLDWSGFPHPFFETERMIEYLRLQFPNKTDDIIGFIYHCLIGDIPLFSIVPFGPVGNARDRFHDSIQNCGIEYLEMLSMVSDYKSPSGDEMTRNYLKALYGEDVGKIYDYPLLEQYLKYDEHPDDKLVILNKDKKKK